MISPGHPWPGSRLSLLTLETDVSRLDGDKLRRDRQFEPPQADPQGEAQDEPSKCDVTRCLRLATPRFGVVLDL